MNANIASRRLVSQHLVGERFGRVEDVVAYLGAVQSQDYAGAKWAIAQRMKDVSDEDIDKLFNDGAILRTHVMRPTWHFVMPEDIRWMLDLTADRVKKLMAYYNRKLDLNDKVFAKCNELIAQALQGGTYLTRTELAAALSKGGVEAKGQKLGHIVMQAELDAVICSGPRRGKQFTYALLEERAPHAKKLERPEALGELAKRYFVSHGPALAQDFAWWSGLTVADAVEGIKYAGSHLVSETTDNKTYWFSASASSPQKAPPSIHLLPNYDEYLISYKDYSPIFSDEMTGLEKPFGNALLAHIVVRNGRVIGGWRRTFQKDKVIIKVDIKVSLSKDEQQRLKDATENYGRFLDMSTTLAW